MGTQDISTTRDCAAHRQFMRCVLNDLDALERMIASGALDGAPRHIGAEQEMILIDRDARPAPVGPDLLAEINDSHVTTEIARFNLEINCDPHRFENGCLFRLRDELTSRLLAVQNVAQRQGTRVLLTGICPTLEPSHLGPENITPRPRYKALDEALRAHRGDDYELRLRGADDLTLRHPSVMLEALNTSFQLHYQVDASDFRDRFNLAQALAGPTLAAAVNSPALFGKRLWRETRIATFQQVVDTRRDVPHGREIHARVRFGEGWVDESVLEIFRNDVARFRLLVTADVPDDACEQLDRGVTPPLSALQTFNSTVYRWNRPCYGVAKNTPHLRIENRILPAGPTIADEIANAALWFGLMHEGVHLWPELTMRLDFADASANFTMAAREGLACHLTWLDGQELSAADLVLHHLLPAADAGLARAGVDVDERAEFLRIIENRVATRQTGAQWILRSAAALRPIASRTERLAALTDAMYARQQSGAPAHEWSVARPSGAPRHDRALAVSDIMSTDLFTVDADECIDLVTAIMRWQRVRHVPVEDHQQRLVGMVSLTDILSRLPEVHAAKDATPIPVTDIMTTSLVTVTPETSAADAVALMRSANIACLPCVAGGRLVGLVTERDVLHLANRLLLRSDINGALKGEDDRSGEPAVD